MKVLNLRCALGHAFEGWFGSESDFLSQQEGGMIACPSCGDHGVMRLPAAPRLNLSGAQAPAGPVGQGGAVASAGGAPPSHSTLPTDARQLWLEAVREVVAQAEFVGDRFPEEVRRIHYGEAPARGVCGQATARECAELREEGIEIFALPRLPGLGETSH